MIALAIAIGLAVGLTLSIALVHLSDDNENNL